MSDVYQHENILSFIYDLWEFVPFITSKMEVKPRQKKLQFKPILLKVNFKFSL